MFSKCFSVLQDVGSIAISKTTKERMAQKYRQKQEEAERKHANHERVELRAVTNDLAQKTRELEQKKKQEELRIKREKERQQEKLRKLSNNNKEEEIKGETSYIIVIHGFFCTMLSP